jgi:hypothetical protein
MLVNVMAQPMDAKLLISPAFRMAPINLSFAKPGWWGLRVGLEELRVKRVTENAAHEDADQ